MNKFASHDPFSHLQRASQLVMPWLSCSEQTQNLSVTQCIENRHQWGGLRKCNCFPYGLHNILQSLPQGKQFLQVNCHMQGPSSALVSRQGSLHHFKDKSQKVCTKNSLTLPNSPIYATVLYGLCQQHHFSITDHFSGQKNFN